MLQYPVVTVIIPTLNEADHVSQLLQDLKSQTGMAFEVVVSDSSSTDRTHEAVMGHADGLNLQFVLGETRGPAFARNTGAAKANSKWLLFLDADTRLPDRQFIQKLVGEAEKRGWQTASTLIATDSSKISDRLGTYLSRGYTSLLAHSRHPVALGSCILTDRRLFKKLGGFDESLAVAEDYDYVSRAGQWGFGFVRSTAYIYNLRRFRQEGALKVFLRSVAYEAYRLTHNYQIRHDPFDYRFGHHHKH